MLPIETAFQIYTDLNGDPLDDGYIYIGQVNQNPITAPVTVFWDAAGTQPAAQPLRTINGYIVRNGTPANIFYSSTYSQIVQDNRRRQVYYAPNSSAYSVFASVVNLAVGSIAALRLVPKTVQIGQSFVAGYYAPGDGGGGNYYVDLADTTSADNGGTIIVADDGGRWKLAGQESWVSIKQFGAKMDDLTPDHLAVQAAINWALSLPNGGSVYVPAGISRLGALINIPTISNKSFTMFGEGAMSKFRSISAPGMFKVGDGISKFGTTYLFKDFAVAQPVAGNVTGLHLQNLNSVRVEGCIFANVQNGIILESTYDARISGCTFYGCSAYGVTTLTSGTNGTKFINNDFGFCGVAINLAANGNQISIRDNDFEVNATAVAINNYTSVQIDGNYIEGGTNVVFGFSGSNGSIDITQNWLGQNAVPTSFQSIIGGKFAENTIFQSTWTASGTVDFFIGRNTLLGGAVVPSTPWPAPGFLNAFSNTGGVWQLAGYIRDENGFVKLRGMVQAAANNIAFQLPVGYRPSALQTFAAIASNGTLAFVSVANDGNVSVTRGSDGTCDLSGVFFQAIS